MKKTNTGDAVDASHIIKKESAEIKGKKENKCTVVSECTKECTVERVSLIQKIKTQLGVLRKKADNAAAAADDALETFRGTVDEMLTVVVLMGELTARRAHQTLGRAGKKKTYGVIALDRRFEHKAESIFEALKESQFGETIEDLIERRRRRIHKMDAIAVRKQKMGKRIERRIDAVIDRFLDNRKRYTIAMASAVGCMMLFCITVNAGTVYNYYYHGTEMGTVKDKTQIEEAVTQVKEDIPENLDADVNVIAEPDVDITYEKQFSFSAAVDSAETIADKLVNSGELEAEGFAIVVNGTTAALVDTQETADKILDTVKRAYCTIDPDTEAAALAAAQGLSADGTENADYEAETSATSAVDAAVARNIILAGSVSSETGVISADKVVTTSTDGGVIDAVPADTAFPAVDYSNIDFTAIDPTILEGVSIDNVAFTDTVSVDQVTAKVSSFSDYEDAISLFLNEDGTSKVLNVETSEIETYTEPVTFETIYQDTDELYEGDTQVITEGIEGEKQIVADVTKDNGTEISREIVSEYITTEPIDEVILRGTKEKPSWVATGVLINPATGRLSSGFGSRWGRTHQGIDIAGAMGSNVVAADGGTVIYASYNTSGYGNLVKIDHGNGMQTYYAHNSKLLVSVGDKVYQGQVIAKMGSTGRSTGTHCHFEVRINGTAVNPLNYVNY